MWIGAHQLLFHEQKQLGSRSHAVVVDESFWEAGLEIWTYSIPIDAIAPVKPQRGFGITKEHDELDALHRLLADALRRQTDGGAVSRRYLDGLTPEAVCARRDAGMGL